MRPEDNPYLQIDDPFAHVKTQHDAASKAHLEFQRLCWELFHVEPRGKRFMEILQERYLRQGLFDPSHPQCKELALYWEGFKEAIRGFYNLGLQHQQYVSGVNNGQQPNTTSGSTSNSTSGS